MKREGNECFALVIQAALAFLVVFSFFRLLQSHAKVASNYLFFLCCLSPSGSASFVLCKFVASRCCDSGTLAANESCLSEWGKNPLCRTCHPEA